MMTFEKPDEIKFVLRTFTEEEIDAMLEQGENFRNLKPRIRDKYAASMRNGWWDPHTGESLAMGADGMLVNGQHRLSAAQIVQRETGKKIWFWVAMNVAGKAAQSMDQGDSRKLVDYMKKDGVTHAVFCAGIASSICRKSMTRGKDATLYSVCGSGAGTESKAPPISMVMDTWRRHRSAIQTWANWSSRCKDVGLARPAVLGSLLYHFALQDESRAKEFAELLITGAGMGPRDPALVLRERLRVERSAKAKLPREHLGALVIRAWVYWMEGRQVTQLKWTSVGPSAQPFPSHFYNKEISDLEEIQA